VVDLVDFRFAHPVRITATARIGEGDVIDIERESELGGPLHSKGVMILSSFLGARYAHSVPLSLAASLVFEQSYGPVEGDSASLAELCALLSVLSGVPILQSLAVTGSVNQHGRVQAVGGVNEKIEGFFDVCAARGLTGAQGVVIPAGNVKHLMLREDVVAAAREGRSTSMRWTAWTTPSRSSPACPPACRTRRAGYRRAASTSWWRRSCRACRNSSNGSPATRSRDGAARTIEA